MKLTMGQLYNPAMKITSFEEAEAYLELLICYQIHHSGMSRAEATANELSNIGYYAGYWDDDTITRVYTLFKTHHPVLPELGQSNDNAPMIGHKGE